MSAPVNRGADIIKYNVIQKIYYLFFTADLMAS